MFDLSGRTALVTGAGQGVGVGIASCLAERGAFVIVNDLHESRATETASKVTSEGGQAVVAAFDITDRDAVESTVEGFTTELGRIVDILVNNAGVPADMTLTRFADMEPEHWRSYVDLNLYGSLNCVRATLGAMREQRWGRVIQISSSAAQFGISLGISLYGASKSAIEGFLRHLSQEVARDGVTANALALGLMSNAVPDDANASDVMARLARTVPVGRLGDPRDVGAAVVYLASDEAGWLNGQTIQLNGGQSTS